MNCKGLSRSELDEYFNERRKNNLRVVSIIVFILMALFSIFGWFGMVDYFPDPENTFFPFVLIFVLVNVSTIVISFVLFINKYVFLED